MGYRTIITIDLPDEPEKAEKVCAALEALDDLDIIIREEGFPTDTLQRFAIVRWFGRCVADIRYWFRELRQGESDAMRALREANEDSRAVGAPHLDRL